MREYPDLFDRASDGKAFCYMDELTETVQAISEELAAMDALRRDLRPLRDMSYPGVYRAQASILHDFYTACERIFLRIAKDIDGDVPQGKHWHIDLLKRMAMERGDIRPEVISENLARALRPYLGFRHVFRNIYGYELDSDRLRPLIERFEGTLDYFQDEIYRFVDFLKQVMDEL